MSYSQGATWKKKKKRERLPVKQIFPTHFAIYGQPLTKKRLLEESLNIVLLIITFNYF